MKGNFIKCFIVCISVLIGCGKNNDTSTGSGNNGGSGGNGGSKDTSCVISTISQTNSGAGAESALLPIIMILTR